MRTLKIIMLHLFHVQLQYDLDVKTLKGSHFMSVLCSARIHAVHRILKKLSFYAYFMFISCTTWNF